MTELINTVGKPFGQSQPWHMEVVIKLQSNSFVFNDYPHLVGMVCKLNVNQHAANLYQAIAKAVRDMANDSHVFNESNFVATCTGTGSDGHMVVHLESFENGNVYYLDVLAIRLADSIYDMHKLNLEDYKND